MTVGGDETKLLFYKHKVKAIVPFEVVGDIIVDGVVVRGPGYQGVGGIVKTGAVQNHRGATNSSQNINGGNQLISHSLLSFQFRLNMRTVVMKTFLY